MRWPTVLIAAQLLSACTFGASHPELVEVTVSQDEMTLWIAVDTCNADLTASIDETQHVVSVEVTARNDTSDDCLDGLRIDLAEPLGSRSVVNGWTEEELAVRGGGEYW